MEFSKFTLAYQQARIMLSSTDEFVNNFFQSTVRQKESCQPPKRFIIQRFQALNRTRFRAPALAATRIYYQIIGMVSTGILKQIAGSGRGAGWRSTKAQAANRRCENPLSAQIAPPVAPFPVSGPEGSVGRGAEFAKMLFPHLAGSGTAHARVI